MIRTTWLILIAVLTALTVRAAESADVSQMKAELQAKQGELQSISQQIDRVLEQMRKLDPESEFRKRLAARTLKVDEALDWIADTVRVIPPQRPPAENRENSPAPENKPTADEKDNHPLVSGKETE